MLTLTRSGHSPEGTPSARQITAGSRALTVLSFTKGCEQEKRLLVAGRLETAVELPAVVNLDFISGLCLKYDP